ncbi:MULTISPECIES: DUF4145 domain-containing protein [Paraburkholderia]|uniref:DUF4145 domain-containing protein n=1 Tax=Paraburkholderia TaxID=1822464 RepID=UPI0038B9C6A9
MEDLVPEFQKEAFKCPRCSAFAHMLWRNLLASSDSYSSVWTACCARCKMDSIWICEDSIERRLAHEGPGLVKQIFPAESSAPMPSSDLPDDCLADYLEAREILTRSPRGAAALLRLVIQKLCTNLGESGKDINKDIAALVRNGLPKRLQEALDIVRVVGNEAVHPGVMDVRDNPAAVSSLFKLVNLIVEKLITEPNAEEDLYRSLPRAKLDGIAQRDK